MTCAAGVITSRLGSCFSVSCNRTNRVTDDIDHGRGSRDDRGVIDGMRSDRRLHAFRHEALRSGDDHPIVLSDQVPSRNFLPQRISRRRSGHTGEPERSLHGCEHGQIIGGCVLCEVSVRPRHRGIMRRASDRACGVCPLCSKAEAPRRGSRDDRRCARSHAADRPRDRGRLPWPFRSGCRSLLHAAHLHPNRRRSSCAGRGQSGAWRARRLSCRCRRVHHDMRRGFDGLAAMVQWRIYRDLPRRCGRRGRLQGAGSPRWVARSVNGRSGPSRMSMATSCRGRLERQMWIRSQNFSWRPVTQERR